MYEVVIRDHFSAGHQLRDLSGICENLHGHNWKVEAIVEAEKLNGVGIVVDFHLVEKEIKNLIDQLDHRVLNELALFQDINPSAENIARYFFEELKQKLHPIRVKKITVWETDTCGASFSC